LLRLYKIFLLQPSWLRPTSARRLLVLRHGPSARLQGVANVAGYEPPVQRSSYGRHDPRFDFCRRDPRFCWTLLRAELDCLHFTESPGYGHNRPGRWQSFSPHTHALVLRASWTVARTLYTHSLRPQSDLCTLSSGAFTVATRVQRAQVIATHLTRVCSQHTTFCMRVLRMHRDAHLLVTLTTLLSCAVLPAFDIACRTTVTPSTRTDFRSRLDRGVTTETFSSPS
jgi:hypothetical protein